MRNKNSELMCLKPDWYWIAALLTVGLVISSFRIKYLEDQVNNLDSENIELKRELKEINKEVKAYREMI